MRDLRPAVLLILAALAALYAAPAAAQTPDGLPPALETVCDMETGAAFGWCNAYCEAMDCELANDSDPLTEPHASANACDKVRTKFQQSTGRDMPCEVTCPCNDPEVSPFFAVIVAGEAQLDTCHTAAAYFGLPDGVVAFSGEFLALSILIEEQWLCGLTNSFDLLPITPEQGQFCADLIEQAANAQGLICEDVLP
jgi:hypothetical protein